MKLRELKLKNFGKFHDKSIQLQDGINVICGERIRQDYNAYFYKGNVVWTGARTRTGIGEGYIFQI